MRLLIAALLLTAAATGPARADVSLAGVRGYDDCDALATRHPDSYEAHRCYWMLSRRGAGFEEAERRLRSRLAVDPDNTLARFMLGKVLQDSGDRERAEPVLRDSIARFVDARYPQGEVHARLSLSSMLALLGRSEDSMTELDAAGKAADRSGDKELAQAVVSERAWNAYRRHDYGHAYAFFHELHAMLDETSPSYLRGEALSGLGASSWGMQRFADSLRYYREEAALRHQVGDRHAEALARGNVLLLLSIVQNIELEERLEYLEESLDAARRAENRRAESTVLRLWALADPGDPRGVERLELAASISRDLSDVTSLCNVLPELAKRVIDDDPTRGFALVDEAIEIARDAANDFGLAQASVTKGHLRWRTGPRDTAIRDSLASLEAIERMRDRQSDSSARAVHFQRWFGAYYELAAQLLRPDGRGATPEEQELAFQIVERMRTRQLIERLDRAEGHRVPDAPEAVLSERENLLEQISEVQNRLMRGLRGAKRTDALAALEQLEHRENVLRAEIARADPEFGALRRPTLPTLDKLRSAIGEDQALLSFQLADDLPISLLVVHTARETRSYPVPTLDALNSAVRLYRGLLERRDDSALESGASLFATLLEQPLAELPDTVRRLVIVPDGPLQQLPFDTLSLDGSGDTLVSRYDLSLTPSISAWLRFREKKPAGSARSVLALADPVHPAHRETAAGGTRESTFGVQLGPLPFARKEATGVVKRLGRGGLAETGENATEALIKSADLRQFRVLHFAAHALLDEDKPERTSILLAPGEGSDDGLLQFREIVNLDLDGQVVVLSACRSATGKEIRGEGVMGLAHAFFQAGARAVIGGLWPLRDDEAERLMRQVYRELDRGASLSEAMARTRRAEAGRGVPAAAWAGLVVMGDGDYAPFSDSPASNKVWIPIVAAAAFGLLVVWTARRRHA